MWYPIFVNALFIPIRLVSSGLVPHNLYPRQALNPRPLQYCRMPVELGGCPYPCVNEKCPCYEFCTDGDQVCNFQLDESVVFQYCLASDHQPASQIFIMCQQYCTDHCTIMDHDDGLHVPACRQMPKGPLDPNRLLSKVQDASTKLELNANFETQPVEPNGATSYSKSLQNSEPHPDDLYLDNLYFEDLSSW